MVWVVVWIDDIVRLCRPRQARLHSAEARDEMCMWPRSGSGSGSGVSGFRGMGVCTVLLGATVGIRMHLLGEPALCTLHSAAVAVAVAGPL